MCSWYALLVREILFGCLAGEEGDGAVSVEKAWLVLGVSSGDEEDPPAVCGDAD